MKRIIMVDDDPMIHKIVDRALLDYDIRLTSIYTGVESLHQFKYKHFDYAFIDQYLGSMMGTEVINALRGIRNGTKIYIMSAAPDDAKVAALKSDLDISGIVNKLRLVEFMKSLLTPELQKESNDGK